jgi:hypothetical protein
MMFRHRNGLTSGRRSAMKMITGVNTAHASPTLSW